MWIGFNLGFTLLEASNEGQQFLATHFTVLSFTRDFFEKKYKGKESIHTLHETFIIIIILPNPPPKKNPKLSLAFASHVDG